MIGRLALCLSLVAGPAMAECRLALLLGLDVSSSVDAAEDALQRQGLARALASPSVRAAALAIPGNHVALSVFEWSGRWQQTTILEWTLLDSPQALEAAGATVAASERSTSEYPTAAGYALGHATTLMADAPDCLFRTLDMSGDGVSNDGFPPESAYRSFPFDEITVNGLPITGHDASVVRFYEDQILHGPGAFLEVADGFEDFERAMRRKLEREMGVRTLGLAR